MAEPYEFYGDKSEAMTENARQQNQVLVRLRNALKDNSLVIIVGAGVTLRATVDISGKPLQRTTWTGLIRNGLNYMVDNDYLSASDKRIKRAYDALEDKDTTSLLDAANIMKSQLAQHGQYPTWLEMVFGSLYEEVRHPAIFEVLKALHEKGAKLLTTNYDDLLERSCSLRRIGRSNMDDILKFKRGDLDGVFHLHGSYHDPHEVVLDTTDYYQVRNSDEVQNVLKTFLEYKTILFIGCGSGLEDPNFSGLLEWAGERQCNVPNRHCLMIRDGDSLNHRTLVRLKYGPDYKDLTPYLKQLLGDPSQARSADQTAHLKRLSNTAFKDSGPYTMTPSDFLELENAGNFVRKSNQLAYTPYLGNIDAVASCRPADDDYADTNMNRQWKSYQATRAAAYAQELLKTISGTQMMDIQTVNEVITKTALGLIFVVVPAPVNLIIKLLNPFESLEPQPSGSPALKQFFEAAKSGNPQGVKKFIDNSHIHPNVSNGEGMTAIAYAAHYGRTGVVDLLLDQYRADPCIPDTVWQQTPLFRAAKGGHVAVVKRLLTCNMAGVNTPDKDGQTALAVAAAYGWVDVVKVLLAYQGVDVTYVDCDGRSALSRAKSEQIRGLLKAALEGDEYVLV